MKIEIITLSASYNCGSMLQTYALKNILSKYGDVEVINFSSKKSHEIYDIIPQNAKQQLKMFIKKGGLFLKLIKERNDYEEFKSKYLGINGKEYFSEDLKEISNKYDVVVVGSDQVWNVKMYDFDKSFFLGWTNTKKIAYAPSLGGHDIRESDEKTSIINDLKKFAFISVRENKGKKCLEDILKTSIEKVLDPTLLIQIEKLKQITKKPNVKRKYIFYYSWAYNDKELREIVKKRSKVTGLPVYVIDAHKWRSHNYKEDGFILYESAGPLAFLSLMSQAKECYVESFHGMIFSYLFRRNFWLLDIHEKYDEIDTRLKEIVELIGAKDRILTKYNNDKINLDVDFEYKENVHIDKMKEKSKVFLKEAFL